MCKLWNKSCSSDGAVVVEFNKGEEVEWAGVEEFKMLLVDEEVCLDLMLGVIRICG